MGILNKLAFWKKKDDLGLDDLGADLGLGQMDIPSGPGMPTAKPGMPAGMGQDMNLGMPDDTGFGGMGQQTPPNVPPSPQPPGRPVPMQQPFSAPVQPQAPAEKDYRSDKFEVVSAKLDSVRYTLESINQRLANLERVAYGEHEAKKRW
ncbi:hypothetical protein KY358_06020 [Candidatus Woesearchaeota archaeon]|nr:hypothetical protein [Candidatus Woesearchaeota archaeon]